MYIERALSPTPRVVTLLSLVQEALVYVDSDDEVVAVVADLLNSGRVRPGGTFAGKRVDVAV
jgi:hypothetical protein